MAKLVNVDSQSIVEITLNTEFGAILTDPDTFPTLQVKLKPALTTVATYTSTSSPAVTKLAVGRYEVTWSIATAGEYQLVWTYAVGGTTYTTTEDIVVYSVGSGPMLGDQSNGDISNYIQRHLGYNVVGVELTADHLDDAIVMAKLWFSSIIGQTKYAVIDVPAGGGAIHYSDIGSDVASVVEVAFDLNQASLYDQFNWAGVELGPLAFGMYGSYRLDGGGVGGGYSYLVQAMQYRDQAKRLLSIDRDWYWDMARRRLILTPTEGNIGTKAAVWYLSNQLDLALLQTYEYMLVKRYALGEAMQALGYIRTKYSEMPSATGTITTNGDTLLANGESIKLETEEKAKMLRPPAQFFAE